MQSNGRDLQVLCSLLLGGIAKEVGKRDYYHGVTVRSARRDLKEGLFAYQVCVS